jgi:type I restriction enzyme S subunit
MNDSDSRITKDKYTEIDIIPEGWEIKEINDLTISVSSGKSKTVSEQGDYPIYGSTGVIGLKKQPDYEGEKILIARVGANAGTINKVNGKYCVSDNTLIVSYKSRIDINFSYYQLKNYDLNRLIFGSGQPLITGSQVKKLTFFIPKKKQEQKAIARVLSDTDALIESLEKLIAKKKAIKQGAMQQLLTGKKRLPGFSGEWKIKKLGDVVEIKKGQLITDNTRVEGNIPVIAGGKIPAYYHNKANRNGKTITISGSGASAGFVSFHNGPIFASDCSTIEDSKRYSIGFIYFILQLFQNKIYKMQTGGAQPHIHPNDLKPIVISIPNYPEQTSIANILSDMDSEIEKLEQKRDKYISLKQGMMQQLLTGKIRLVKNGDN